MKALLDIPVSEYDLYDELAELLESHEGRRTHVYEDSESNWTIGVGHLLAKGIPEVVIDLLLLCDMQEAKGELDKIYPEHIELDRVRQLVLLDMMFNLGTANFLTFKKFWAAMEAGQFEIASEEMLDSKWAKQVGRRAYALSAMMKDGEIG